MEKPKKTSTEYGEVESLMRLERLYESVKTAGDDEKVKMEILKIKKSLHTRTLNFYQKMKANGKNPFSVFKDNACDACHLVIPQNQIVMMKKSGTTLKCPHCGRFLIEEWHYQYMNTQR